MLTYILRERGGTTSVVWRRSGAPKQLSASPPLEITEGNALDVCKAFWHIKYRLHSYIQQAVK